MKNTIITIITSLSLVACAHAATVLEVVAATAHNGGNWTTTLGHISDSVNGNGSNGLGTADHTPGMDISADPNDPSTWTNTASPGNWNQEWLANGRLDSTTSANNKIGYFIVDFGASIANLQNMYLWAGRHNTGTDEDMRNYNLYYSNGVGIDALPTMPNSKSWANGSQAAADYVFGNGDWSLITNQTLGSPSDPWGVDQTVALGSITARYIGIEILTAGNADPTDRVGFAQVEFTAIPEPSAVLLGGLGALLLLRRRRG